VTFFLKKGYVYSQAKKVIGIEINDFFCNVQQEIIKKFGFEDRVQVQSTPFLDLFFSFFSRLKSL